MNSVSTPPCRTKSSINRPISLSANAVQTAVFKPKTRRSPRAALYSPPPSQTLNSRAARTRPSPGSRRSMISPRASKSYLHEAAGLMFSMVIESVTKLLYQREAARNDLSQNHGSFCSGRTRDIAGTPKQCLMSKNCECQGFLGGIVDAKIVMGQERARLIHSNFKHPFQLRIFSAPATKDDLQPGKM